LVRVTSVSTKYRAAALYICRDKKCHYNSLTKRKLKMKNLIATLVVAVAATSAFAQTPAKVEEVKKPAAATAAAPVPATPKEMPKVEKPKTKAEKEAEAKAKAAKPADTKSATPAPAPAVKADEKAPAKPATAPTK
jgi:hypothetical protein